MATATYTASLRTRLVSSSGNYKTGSACQEYAVSGNNCVGIVHFAGMNLANKVIASLVFRIDAGNAGYGDDVDKTVYLRRSKYQEASADGITGAAYAGTALGTVTGRFYGNTSAYSIAGTLLTTMAGYIASGNNTFIIYNPSPQATDKDYSRNYLEWTAVTLTVEYEEVVSQPTTSVPSAALGTAVTIYTNSQISSATHSLSFAFGSTSGTIATNVGASVSWTPPLSLADELTNATAGACIITCQTYYGGTLTSTRTCRLTLSIPDTMVPTISSVVITDTNDIVVTRIGKYVKTLSKLNIAITAQGTQDSTIVTYRTYLDGTVYTTPAFTAVKPLSEAGNVTMTITVTDSRGKSATYTETIQVLDYHVPSIQMFSAERCSSDGSVYQQDGTKIHYSFTGSVIPLNNKNGVRAYIYYLSSGASEWVRSEQMTISSYNIVKTNQLLAQSFPAETGYSIKVILEDFFYTVEQSVVLGTKQVLIDLLQGGTGIAFGKTADTPDCADFGWPLKLSEPLAVEYGGTGAATAEAARANIGANNASNLSTGIVSRARLPFKVVYGSGSVSSSKSLSISYAAANFVNVPYIAVCYSTTDSSVWSGAGGALKVYNKSTAGCTVIVGGSYTTLRAVDWIAVGY